jgi:hypothetical protein
MLFVLLRAAAARQHCGSLQRLQRQQVCSAVRCHTVAARGPPHSIRPPLPYQPSPSWCRERALLTRIQNLDTEIKRQAKIIGRMRAIARAEAGIDDKGN